MKSLLRRLLLLGTVLMALAPAAAAADELILERRGFYDAQAMSAAQVVQEGMELPAWDDEWTTYKDQLTGDAIAIYESLEAAFANDTAVLEEGSSGPTWTIPEALVIKRNCSRDEFNALYSEVWDTAYLVALQAGEAFVHDHPEYFWIRQAFEVDISGSILRDEATFTVSLGLVAMPKTDTVEERDALQAQLDAVIDHILSQAEGMSDIEKLLYFDAWLCRNNTYYYDASVIPNYIDTDETPWSIVGSMLPGYAPVCEGYAKAFQLLCQRSAIPCLQVEGYANGGGHMWTAVRYQDEWYFCDPTWDDPLVGGHYNDRKTSTRTYFMKSHPNDSHMVYMANTYLTPPEITSAGLSSALYPDCHLRVEDMNAVPPTCDMPGQTASAFCACCGLDLAAQQTIPPAHTPRTLEEKPATCQETGLTEGEDCAVCGVILTAQQEIPVVEHSYTGYASDGNASCVADGTESALCDYGCGTTDTRTVAGTMIPHSHTEYVYNEDATCVADGTETALCDYGCGTADTRTAVGSMIPHSHTEYAYNEDATCVSDGTETALCDYGCGTADTRTAVGSMIPHSHTVYVYNEDATCVADGTETALCDYGCGAANTRTAAGSMIPHSHTVYAYNEDATCVADGTETALCDYGCGITDTRTVADTMIPHSFTHYVYDRANAVKTAECDYGCGATDTLGIAGDETWAWTAEGLTGEEYGSAEYVMIAVFDSHGRMIGVGVCEEEYLNTVDGEQVHHFFAPRFDASVIARAAKVIRFSMGSGYMPDGVPHFIYE